MAKRVIDYCYIIEGKYQNEVWIKYYDTGEEKCIYKYYPDEIRVDRCALFGLTEKEALNVLRELDTAYLQS